MPVEILPTSEKHVESLNAGLDRIARERRFLSFLEGPSVEESASFVRANIEQGWPQFVALDAELVVGWCDIAPMKRPVFAHRGVLGMGVLPEFRGRGIGRRLIVEALAAARGIGLTRIDLDVREDNAPAIALYRSVGFVDEGLKRAAMRIDGQYFNLLQMGLVSDDMA